MIFWNSEAAKSIFKVIRLGVNREYFSKFYRIEEDKLMSTVAGLPRRNDWEGFKEVCKERIDAM